MKNSKIILAALLSFTLNILSAQAAEQGSLGTSSTGSKKISITIHQTVKIKGSADIANAKWEKKEEGLTTETDKLGVYSNIAYNVEASENNQVKYKVNVKESRLAISVSDEEFAKIQSDDFNNKVNVTVSAI